MAGRRAPSRTATVLAQTPKVSDAKTQRAFDVIGAAVLDLQSRRHLEQFTATEPGYVPESGGETFDFLAADGTWKTVIGAGAVDTVTAGSAKVTVSPTTGNVVVDVVPSQWMAGTTSTIAKFTAANVIGNSTITDDGALVTITNALKTTGAVDFDSTLNVDGAAVFVSTVSIQGSATIGDAAGDAHVINGTADFNHAVNLDSTLTMSLMTSGSVPYFGVGGVVTQNNADFLYDTSTGGTLRITPNSNSVALYLTNNGASATVMGIQNLDVTGPVEYAAVDNGSTIRATWGYGNASYFDLTRRSRAYHWRDGVDFVIGRTSAADMIISSAGVFTINGATTINSTLLVTGAVTFNSTLSVLGNTTLGNANTDTTTVNGYAYFAGDASIRLQYLNLSGARYGMFYNNAGALSIGGAASVGGAVALEVARFDPNSGAVLFPGSVQMGDAAGDAHVVNGTVDFNHAVNIDGAVTMTSTLAVTGAITENGVAVLAGTIAANTIPKGSGGNLVDSAITDNGTSVGMSIPLGIIRSVDATSGPQNFVTLQNTFAGQDVSYGWALTSLKKMDFAGSSGTSGFIFRGTSADQVVIDTTSGGNTLQVTGKALITGTATVTGSTTLNSTGGDTTVAGQLLVKGGNTNTAPTPLAQLETFGGRNSAGVVQSSDTSDLAFNFGGNNGGFRHWISTWHNTVANSTNRISFYVNSGATAGASSAPGTGNVNVLDLYGDASAKFYGALDVTGAITENGVAVLAGAITANALPKGSGGNLVDSAITDNGTTIAFADRKLTDTYTGSGTLAALSMTGTGLTANGIVMDVSSSATYDTSGGALSATGMQFILFGTKSAGAAAFTQTAATYSATGADTNIALRTNSGANLLNATDSATSIGYASGAAPSTHKLGVKGDATATVIGAVNTSTAQGSHTGISSALSGTCAAAGARTATGFSSAVTVTRASGAADVTNLAGTFTSSGAQINIALRTVDGSNYLNSTSGSTGIGYASAAALPATLSVTGTFAVTGAATFASTVQVSGTTATISSGTGTPEGVVTAPVGSIFLRTDNANSFYVKQTGAGNTGWVLK